MATYWENSCSFGLRYVSWYKYLIVSLVFSRLGFWSGNLFLIAPFPDLCLLVPFDVYCSISFLLKCNIATSELCDFCTMEIESINHLFWECLYVQQFWTETSNFLKDYNVDINFSLKTVFFRYSSANKYSKHTG